MKRKQILAIIIVVVMAISLSATALAADAGDVRAKLTEIAAKYPGNTDLRKAVDEANIWLSNSANAARITDSVASTILSEISKAEATIGTTGRLADLTDAQIESVMRNITVAANAAGLTIQTSANLSTITILDGDNAIFTIPTGLNTSAGTGVENNPIRQTGFEADITGIIIAGCIIIILTLTAIVILAYMPKRKAEKALINKDA